MDKHLSEKIAKIVKCPTCLGVLLRSMVQPLRCGGLSWKNGVLVNRLGTPWSDVTKRSEDRRRRELEDYVEKNKDHITKHGLVHCNRKKT